MRFDASRLAVLAGLPQNGSGLLREGTHDQEEAADLGLFEDEHDEGAGHEDEGAGHGDEGVGHYEAVDDIMEADADADDDDDDAPDEDEVVTVDENLLRREIAKMKHQRLAENKIRKAVRQEIAAILSEEYDDDNLYLTSDWLYGDNKPTNSRKGTVATALPGLGFKKF